MGGFEIIGVLVILALGLVALRMIRKSKAKVRHDRTQAEPNLSALTPALPILGLYFALPYWATLSLIRPWSENAHVRAFARKAVGPFLWLNTLWVICPVIAGIYFAYANVNWGIVVGLYIVAALVFHSAVAHSA